MRISGIFFLHEIRIHLNAQCMVPAGCVAVSLEQLTEHLKIDHKGPGSICSVFPVIYGDFGAIKRQFCKFTLLQTGTFGFSAHCDLKNKEKKTNTPNLPKASSGPPAASPADGTDPALLIQVHRSWPKPRRCSKAELSSP